MFSIVYSQRQTKILDGNIKTTLKGNQKNKYTQIEQLFNKETQSCTFYNQIRQHHPILDEDNQIAMQNFFRVSETSS